MSEPRETVDPRELEASLAAARLARFKLVLVLAGMTPRSRQALDTIRTICETYLADRYDLEVVDIYQQPERGGDLDVVAAPTLVKLLPLPLRRVIGDLTQGDRVLVLLGIGPNDIPTLDPGGGPTHE